MRIKWLATALRNIEEEAEFVARENPAAAQALVQRIHAAVNHLEANPQLGRPGRIHGTRELVTYPFATRSATPVTPQISLHEP